MTNETNSQQPASSSPLPILTLVLSFFVPVVSIVLGHIALNQMSRGQIASDQKGIATAGLVLGYVFTALIASFFAVYVFIFAGLMTSSYPY